MLTKDDKKYISTEVATQISNALNKNNDILVKEMIDLFNATNSVIEKLDTKLSGKIDDTNKRLDETNERVERILDNQNRDFESIENLEKRTEKLEEKVFSVSA